MADEDRHEDDAAAKAQAAEEAQDEAKQKMEKLEEGDPPDDLEDWPDDEAKYETYGGPEGPHSYAEGPEEKLGPSGVRHHEDGSVSIDGEKVDNPEDFKSDPIPGGPTDPNAPDVAGERDENKREAGEEHEGGEEQHQEERSAG